MSDVVPERNDELRLTAFKTPIVRLQEAPTLPHSNRGESRARLLWPVRSAGVPPRVPRRARARELVRVRRSSNNARGGGGDTAAERRCISEWE